MNTPSTAVLEAAAGSQETPPPAMSPTRPMYWSVRRELWESRSIYLAPLIVTTVYLFGFLLSTVTLPHRMRGLSALDPAKQVDAVAVPYGIAASIIIVTGFLIGVFYSLDALNSERRDRSILFWKSLPVSDRTTVLSKALIPFAVLPLLCFAFALATQAIMLFLSTAVLMANRLNPAELWTRMPFQMPLVLFYGLVLHVFWYAPVYGWLLLVSAWARRAAFLWAVLPFFAIYVVERVAFGTAHFASFLKYRLSGAMDEGFAMDPRATAITRLSQLEPLRFLSSPGLWIGLMFAAAFLAAAVRLRRNREPM